MSLSDSGLRVNPLQNDHIGSLCVLSERAGRGSAISPSTPSSYGCDWSAAGRRSIFHPIHTRDAVSSPPHMFPIRRVFILPHDVLGRGSLSSLRY